VATVPENPVRKLGEVADIDGGTLYVGLDFDTVQIDDHRIAVGQLEEFAHLFIAASFEAKECAARLPADERAAAATDGPVFVTMNADPPKPPYGSPERAAWDASHG
jgi:hypothetical protein